VSDTYRFRQFYIPERMLGGLTRYVDNGIKPGGFLTAVISNDLREAVWRADGENLAKLPAYVAWLYNEAPKGCWGSRENMQRWMESFRENSDE
jgi:hypothetical protein